MKHLLIIGVIAILCLDIACCDEQNNIVWRLGNADGDEKDFSIPHNAWEYARHPWVKSNPDYNWQSGVFKYKIKNKISDSAPLPRQICGSFYTDWVPRDEIVQALEIAWEDGGGFRKLDISLAKYKDRNGLPGDLRLELPGGYVKHFNIPTTGPGRLEGKGPLTFSVEFEAEKGENKIVVRDIMNSRENYIVFDGISLSKIDRAAQLKPLIELKTDSANNVFDLNAEGKARVLVLNKIPENSSLAFIVKDFWGKQINTGEVPAKACSEISLPCGRSGYFELNVSLKDKSGKIIALDNGATSVVLRYAALPSADADADEKSPFGFNILPRVVDGKINNLKIIEDVMLAARRAGAKWARIHCFDWRTVQPDGPEKYYWEHYDRLIDTAMAYGISVMPNICYIPRWASSASENTSSVPYIGQQAWTVSPPKDMSVWHDFMKKAAERYKDKVTYWEVWNEPNYTSCFWICGSPSAYTQLLKNAHEGIKKGNPRALTVSGAPLSFLFFQDMIKLGAGNFFDVHSYHYASKVGDPQKWADILKSCGDKPMMNSEEAIVTADERLLAEDIIKLHARNFTAGCKKMFMFVFFGGGGLDRQECALWTDGSPRPGYCAYRTMTSVLKHPVPLGSLPSLPDIEQYLYDCDGNAVLVLWSNAGKKTVSLSVNSAEAERINIMGESETIKTPNGVLTIEVDSMPVFIKGGDLKHLKKQASLNIRILPENPVFLTGKVDQLVCTLKNSLDKPAKVLLQATPPPGIKMTVNAPVREIQPGENVELQISFEIPAGNKKTLVNIPAELIMEQNGDTLKIPLRIEFVVCSKMPGENLLPGLDTKTKGEIWFLGNKDNSKLVIEKESGVNGMPALRGTTKNNQAAIAFHNNYKIPVIAKEKYVLSLWAKKLSGVLNTNGAQISFFDDSGTLIHPSKPGINCLFFSPSEKWNQYSDIIEVPEKARFMCVYFCCAYNAEGELLISDIRMNQLANGLSANKALFQGVGFSAPDGFKIGGDMKQWSNGESMSIGGKKDATSAKMFWDKNNLYLCFKVKDEKFCQNNEAENLWKGDSVQFSIDPEFNGKDYTEFCVALAPSGPTLYRSHCYYTPELMTTMYVGVVKEAETIIKHSENETVYEIKLPLSSVFPLAPKKGKKIGFSWLVNNNDGAGRNYQEWSSGIGGTKDAGKFGQLIFE